MHTHLRYVLPGVLLATALITSMSCDSESGGNGESVRTSDDVPFEIVLDSGYFYVVGYDTIEGNERWRIEKRSTVTGALVDAFGSGGVVTSNPSTGFDVAYSIAIDSENFFVAGCDEDVETGIIGRRIEKRNKTTGNIEQDFYTDGVHTYRSPFSHYASRDIDIQEDDIVVVSNVVALDNSYYQIYYLKLGTVGIDVMANGGSSFSPGKDTVYDSVPHPTNPVKIYFVGSESTMGDLQWLIVEGDHFNFFTQVERIDPGVGSDDEALALANDDSYLYIAGYDTSTGSKQWRIQKHAMSDLSIVAGFGGGAVTSVAGEATGITADADYIYVVGNDDSTAERMWRIEKRDKDTGDLVVSFGSNGVVQSNPSTGVDGVTAMAIDSTHLYVIGWKLENGYKRWHIEIRNKTTGAV